MFRYAAHAVIGSDATCQDWLDLCQRFSHDNVISVVFDYANYSDFDSMLLASESSQPDLLTALSRAHGLESVVLKGSSFPRLAIEHETSPAIAYKNIFDFYEALRLKKSEGLGRLIKGLQACQNLEKLCINNYGTLDLDGMWEEIAKLIEHSPQLVKLTFMNVNIVEQKGFKLFCEMLSKLNRRIELDFPYGVTFSTFNKLLLRQALEENELVIVSSEIRTRLNQPSKKASVLCAASFGVAACLTGLSLFASLYQGLERTPGSDAHPMLD